MMQSDPNSLVVSRDQPTVAVVLAGGTGARIGLDVPKQLLKIAGKTVLEHTVGALNDSSDIDEILVLMTPGYEDVARDLLLGGPFGKVSAVLSGGSTRAETTQIALKAIDHDECNVLFHDAVRPLLSPRIIRECVNALRVFEAVDVAIASPDTIIAVDADDNISAMPPRSSLRLGQTPQGFRLSTIRRAYDLASKDTDFVATDDCGVVHRYLPDVSIKVIEGSADNMKITLPVDVFIVDKLFQLASQFIPAPAPGLDYADELRGRTMVVFGGRQGIGADIVRLAREYGADVFSFSRRQTATHVENPHEVRTALADAYARTGRIDYVVLTAGVLHTGPLADLDTERIDEAVGVNFLAPINVARASIDYLSRTRGQLLLYTSSSYTRGRANYALYSACKAAVVNLVQALADEWSSLGVRVNCMNPERTATPMRTRAFGEEPVSSLLASEAVAQASLDVLLSRLTGHVFDVRRQEIGANALARA
jgi:ribitol-5-phosphate 2-dehydrogenase (NADP+) / D-ribitol-5-phosphate cytidylyltransferase